MKFKKFMYEIDKTLEKGKKFVMLAEAMYFKYIAFSDRFFNCTPERQNCFLCKLSFIFDRPLERLHAGLSLPLECIDEKYVNAKKL